MAHPRPGLSTNTTHESARHPRALHTTRYRYPTNTMPMRKDYNEIIALANDVGRKQAFMQYYGELCSSAAASFDEHGHNDEASYYLSNDPVLLAAYDHFKNTLEAAWSSTTVDAEFTSCSR